MIVLKMEMFLGMDGAWYGWRTLAVMGRMIGIFMWPNLVYYRTRNVDYPTDLALRIGGWPQGGICEISIEALNQ